MATCFVFRYILADRFDQLGSCKLMQLEDKYISNDKSPPRVIQLVVVVLPTLFGEDSEKLQTNL